MKRFAYVFTAVVFIVLLASGCQKAPFSASPAPTVTIAPTIAPTAEPTATVKPTPTLPPEAFAELVLEKVNNARIENGLEPLKMSPSLCAAATIRADELRQKSEAINEPGYMNNILSREQMHSRLNGDNFSTVLDEVGITKWEWASENVNYAKQSDYGVTIDSNRAFTAWKNSPDHWEAILYKNWTKTGIAVVYNNGIAYAVQLFTTGHKEAPEYANPSPTITP